MIPTFNCARFLRQTLESVLIQDPGPGSMQVEVVDDCSTQDDPEAVVREVGKGRIGFHRKPRNEGAIRNFNTCIERSRGHLVHILHGDDFVLPDFYNTIREAADQHPGCALVASRSFFTDEDGIIIGLTERLKALEEGGRDVQSFFYSTPIQTPGVVVRRAFYETHGGFLPGLVHTADCEMWARSVGTTGGVVTREILACYRTFSSNDSGRLARSGGNLRDLLRLNSLFQGRYAGFDPNIARRRVWCLALSQAERFGQAGDQQAAQANLEIWRQVCPWPTRLRVRSRRALDPFIRSR